MGMTRDGRDYVDDAKQTNAVDTDSSGSESPQACTRRQRRYLQVAMEAKCVVKDNELDAAFAANGMRV